MEHKHTKQQSQTVQTDPQNTSTHSHRDRQFRQTHGTQTRKTTDTQTHTDTETYGSDRSMEHRQTHNSRDRQFRQTHGTQTRPQRHTLQTDP